MLTISLEKLAYIVEKARGYDAEVPVDRDYDEGSDAADDDERRILLDTPDNPTAQELRDAIDGLNLDEREELLALMWLGRGDNDAPNWSEALTQRRATPARRPRPNICSEPRSSATISKRASKRSVCRSKISSADSGGPRPCHTRPPRSAAGGASSAAGYAGNFLAAFNNAWASYADRGPQVQEEIAFGVAWAAVKKQRRKRGVHWVAEE